MAGYFIAGTDTGVGKTFIAAALVRHFAQQKLAVIGMKPVAAGCELVNGEWLSEDVMQLREAANVTAPLHLINPYAFEPAIAPHIAAERLGVVITLPTILQAYQQLTVMADMVIVEGVGGVRVPLGPQLDTADLAVALGLPVILVVGMRLGCINHALLSVEALQARGLKLAGWVANQVDTDMLALEENQQALLARIAAPCIASVAWGTRPNFSALAPS